MSKDTQSEKCQEKKWPQDEMQHVSFFIVFVALHAKVDSRKGNTKDGLDEKIWEI